MTIALTGHRPNKLLYEWDGKGPISDAIFMILCQIIEERKPTKGISGMALGADMLWAEALIEKEVPFIAAIPCKGQEKMWPKKSQWRYNEILSSPLCTKFIVSDGGYSPYKMQKRNEWMVDNCDLLIGVHDGSNGGTYNCIQYAKGKVETIIINPKSLI